MTIKMAEDVGVMLQKGLAEWWSEETEYIFQRIERWAAYARGYNRLRSQRLSRGRMTMQGGQEPRWSISSNKLIIDDSSWSPRFHTLKKSRRKSRPEETKINCCGTFNYQSNSNLDSTCLETYRYDHSIYFKTIGDIKNSKKEAEEVKNEEDRISISSEELVEWDVNAVSDFIANQILEDGFQNVLDAMDNSDPGTDEIGSVTWFNIDLSKLDLNEETTTVSVVDEQNNQSNMKMKFDIENEENNNNHVMDENLKNQTQFVVEDEEDIERFIDIRRTEQFPITDGRVFD
ncbi:uncharacterized protein LOC114871935 [Osmia bicornis bicornis]|uniref:uncharacterized protein LOC114871935 n=1 Tax=Osmia bicornis bicornis TaxID=1437191 RepID=UPI0010F6C833|nr:uncharacterized protein LOC114871935 [Osmia bicornis bicornis]